MLHVPVQADRRQLPQSGKFSVKEWGAVLQWDSRRLHDEMKRLRIPVVKGKISAVAWWKIVDRQSRREGDDR